MKCQRFQRAVVICGCMFFAFSSAARSQTPSYSSQGTGSHHQFTLQGHKLEIDLDGISSSANWALGIAVKPGSQVELVATSVAMENDGAVRNITSMSSVDQNLDLTSQGLVRFHDLNHLSGYLCVFMTIPSGTDVQVRAGGDQVFAGRPVEGLTLQNGKLFPHTPWAIGDVVLLFKNGWPSHVLRPLANGKYYGADSQLLLQHAISAPLPSPSTTQGMVMVSIVISSSGAVTKVNSGTGNPGLISAAEQVLYTWKFRPFEVSGKPVVVVAPVMLSFTKGKVVSSLQQNPIMTGQGYTM